MSAAACVQCGGRVGPKRTKDGKRVVGSVGMLRYDTKHWFCSMRCAAAYGIRAAQSRARKPA